MDTSAWIKALIFMFSQVLLNASKTFETVHAALLFLFFLLFCQDLLADTGFYDFRRICVKVSHLCWNLSRLGAFS